MNLVLKNVDKHRLLCRANIIAHKDELLHDSTTHEIIILYNNTVTLISTKVYTGMEIHIGCLTQFEVSSIVRYDTLSNSKYLRTFRNSLMPKSAGSKQSKNGLTIEAVRPSETSACLHQSTRHHIPEDLNLHLRHCHDLKSHMIQFNISSTRQA